MNKVKTVYPPPPPPHPPTHTHKKKTMCTFWANTAVAPKLRVLTTQTLLGKIRKTFQHVIQNMFYPALIGLKYLGIQENEVFLKVKHILTSNT